MRFTIRQLNTDQEFIGKVRDVVCLYMSGASPPTRSSKARCLLYPAVIYLAAGKLSGTIRRFAERQVRDRGLNEALLGSHTAGLAFAEQRRAHAKGLEQLVERAHSAGVLRPEVTAEDVRTGLLAIASFRALPPQKANTATRRLAGLLLAGLSPRQP